MKKAENIWMGGKEYIHPDNIAEDLPAGLKQHLTKEYEQAKKMKEIPEHLQKVLSGDNLTEQEKKAVTDHLPMQKKGNAFKALCQVAIANELVKEWQLMRQRLATTSNKEKWILQGQLVKQKKDFKIRAVRALPELYEAIEEMDECIPEKLSMTAIAAVYYYRFRAYNEPYVTEKTNASEIAAEYGYTSPNSGKKLSDIFQKLLKDHDHTEHIMFKRKNQYLNMKASLECALQELTAYPEASKLLKKDLAYLTKYYQAHKNDR